MPTKRRRRTRNVLPGLSEGTWALLLDEEPPADINAWEEFNLRHPTASEEKCRGIWLSVRETAMPQYIAAHSCSRPSLWYLFDPECPRVEAPDIIQHHWQGCFWLTFTPALRLRLGGCGTPNFQVFNYVP